MVLGSKPYTETIYITFFKYIYCTDTTYLQFYNTTDDQRNYLYKEGENAYTHNGYIPIATLDGILDIFEKKIPLTTSVGD